MLRARETTSILPTTAANDVAISMIFDPNAPRAALDIAVDAPLPMSDHKGYLAVSDAALARLVAYRQGYEAATQADTSEPLPFTVDPPQAPMLSLPALPRLRRVHGDCRRPGAALRRAPPGGPLPVGVVRRKLG